MTNIGPPGLFKAFLEFTSSCFLLLGGLRVLQVKTKPLLGVSLLANPRYLWRGGPSRRPRGV